MRPGPPAGGKTQKKMRIPPQEKGSRNLPVFSDKQTNERGIAAESGTASLHAKKP